MNYSNIRIFEHFFEYIRFGHKYTRHGLIATMHQETIECLQSNMYGSVSLDLSADCKGRIRGKIEWCGRRDGLLFSSPVVHPDLGMLFLTDS
ncbi:hypothetical protein Y032_0477g2189 [Ancylostoma ceylanicum]|uniref:Uncharacterized protein n=1 Tax=Ancylostoma ceylanicum TaxID=53326 RepID=A0A016WY23_9BILA|nr:hypothetical protein Y032_0477g2189 [Ancylostoma ceylanicum]